MNPNPVERSEKLLAGMMLSGVWAIGLSLFLGFIGFFSRADGLFNFSVGLFGLGVLLALLTVLFGVLRGATPFLGFEKSELNCRVMARYGVNHLNDVVVADLVHYDESIRTFVRIYSPSRGAIEYECAFPVWSQCGEGMPGKIVYRGTWLCAFFPQQIASPPAQP